WIMAILGPAEHLQAAGGNRRDERFLDVRIVLWPLSNLRDLGLGLHVRHRRWDQRTLGGWQPCSALPNPCRRRTRRSPVAPSAPRRFASTLPVPPYPAQPLPAVSERNQRRG